MGIPSYYRKLIRENKGLVRQSHPGTIDWLWMDFNCLIYHCLRSPGLRPYPGLAGKAEWEAEFLAAIIAYTKRVVAEVRPSKGVYIAVDGVVPMAKMKQQRLRRFKSSWLAEKGLAEGQEAGRERWDTNSITPGTVFMDKLKKALEKEKKWKLSSSDEPGEGEHKVMAQMRACGPGAHAVYGLDADLIVLSLLTQDTLAKEGKATSVHLFREQVVDGALVRDAAGAEVFEWFSIDELRTIVAEQVNIRTYCCAMSFLGNDFLPSSLGLKMREDGHDVLMGLLEGLKVALLKDDEVDEKGLKALLKGLAFNEEHRIESFVRRKGEQGRVYMGGALPVGDPNWALQEQEESCLIRGGRLVKDWKNIYRNRLLEHASVEATCRTYMEGLCWIWNYYRGKDVCYNWYFPWDLPPLWSELVGWAGAFKAPDVLIGSKDIQPVEQLCLVLPPASWDLIPSARHRQLRARAPWLFPSEFRFQSAGKRWFWECEPVIPIPSIREVKAILL